MSGRDPNEVVFNTTGYFGTNPFSDGWRHVVVRMTPRRSPDLANIFMQYVL